MEMLNQTEIEAVSGGGLAYDVGHAVGKGCYGIGSWLGEKAGNLIARSINLQFSSAPHG